MSGYTMEHFAEMAHTLIDARDSEKEADNDKYFQFVMEVSLKADCPAQDVVAAIALFSQWAPVRPKPGDVDYQGVDGTRVQLASGVA